MKKVRIIATILKRMGAPKIEDAENMVKRDFHKFFPDNDFNAWNTEVPAAIAERILHNITTPMQLDIKRFIKDLWSL